MKLLQRMLLINWHYFSQEVLEFEKLTFLTGKTGTGKSTIIDALQLVLLADTSGNYFNKSANGKSRRTILGYLRGELGDDEAGGFTYLRNEAFSSYIVLEFYDEEKARCFTAGCCFDVYNNSDMPHRFFGYEGAMPKHLFVEKQTPMCIEKLQQWLRAEHPESTKLITTYGKEFRPYLYGKLGGLQSKFSDLFKKAVPFTPIADIQTFITEFVFGNEKPVDIAAMQETIESYTEMEKEADKLQQRRELLEDIAAQYGEYRRLRAQERLHLYIAGRAECDLAAQKLERIKQQLRELQQELQRQQAELVQKQNQCNTVNEQYINIRAAQQNHDLNRKIEELERSARELKEKIRIWLKSYEKRDKDLAALTENWQGILQNCCALPTQTGVLGERASVSLQTLREQLQAAEKAVQTAADKPLADIDLAAVQQADQTIQALETSVLRLHADVEQDRKAAEQAENDLREEQKVLLAGRQSYPQPVNLLRQNLRDRLTAQGRHGDAVRLVADLWDVRDPAWRNAAEGYLNTQRCSILVAEEDYPAAAAIYDDIKDKLHIHNVAVVDIAAVRRLNPVQQPGSLAEEIVTDDADARLYADFLLGRVMKCDRLQDHTRNEISLTRDGMLYSQKAIRHLNPSIWAKPLLGQGARTLQLQQIEEELPRCRRAVEQLIRWEEVLQTIPRRRPLGSSEIEDWQAARQDYARLPEAHRRYEEVQSELSAIDRAPLLALQEQEKELFDRLQVCQTEVEKLRDSISRNDERCRTLQQTHIPNAMQAFHSVEQTLQNAYPAEWRDRNEPRYLQEAERAGLETVAANFHRSAQGANTSAEKAYNVLRDKRREYNRLYQMGLDTDSFDNEAFDAALQEIRANRLPEYQSKIRDAKEKAKEQFRDEFIGALNNNINNALRSIRELNRALRTPFSEDSYAFQVQPNPDYRRFYQMLTDPMNLQSRTLFADTFQQKYAAEIEELFQILTDTKTGDIDKRVEKYTNYRTYLQFDLTVTTPDGTVQRLSRMMNKKSGGETQTPFYIAVLASFAQLYRTDRDPRGSTLRLIVFDEAFSKMDGERIAQSIKMLRELNFQVLLAAPPDKIGDISTLVDRNLIVLRKGHTTIVRAFDPREVDDANA